MVKAVSNQGPDPLVPRRASMRALKWRKATRGPMVFFAKSRPPVQWRECSKCGVYLFPGEAEKDCGSCKGGWFA